MIILSKKFPHDGQEFEIFVKYDDVKQKPVEVKNINLFLRGSWYPVGSIMTKFFKDAVWELITKTDWETIRIELQTQCAKYREVLGDLHPVMLSVFGPFVTTEENTTINN
jgi:hypothetical protein